MTMQAYWSGQALYGDDFDDAALRQWFADEEKGYYGLTEAEGEPYAYGYHRLNQVHGYRLLRNRQFDRCLAIGCARGDEIAPLANQIGRMICLEPAEEWWSNAINGVPATYMKPSYAGRIPLADASVDLIICLGVLHHIPNVSLVIEELARVSRAGGMAIIREPIHAMGDWRKPRRGLTRNERGIPLRWLTDRIQAAGFAVTAQHACMFPALARIGRSIGIRQPYNSRMLVAADALASRLTQWNDHYLRDSFFKKLAPSSAFLVLERRKDRR